MNRLEFVIATAVILLVAFALGWFAHWLVHRFTRVGDADMGELDRMAQSLHEAEDDRDRTRAFFQAREAELQNKLVQARAELDAAMDGLRDARAEAEELRSYIERVNQRL